MSSVNTFTLNKLDPQQIATNPVRSFAGIVRTGTVTYDVDYGEFARWIYVGTTGTLAYMKWDGETETLPSIAAGTWHPITSVRILSSGTTIAANQLRWGS